MNNTYELNTKILSSNCDSTGKLGIPQIFNIFMDAATEHAEILGIGISNLMPEKLFWVTSKTKIKIYELPAMCEAVTVVSWPEKPDRVRSNRNYRLLCGEKVCVEGKTEWAVINLDTGKFQPPGTVFPEGLELREDSVWTEPFSRVKSDFEDEPFATYKVLSTDIDVGGHMNNAAYIRALMSLWTNEEWIAMNISEMEVFYKNQCYEGQVLAIQKKTDESGRLQIRASVEDKTIFQAIIA